MTDALAAFDRHRPRGVAVGEAVLWSAPDGTPLGVTCSAVPAGPVGLWAALTGRPAARRPAATAAPSIAGARAAAVRYLARVTA